MIALQAHALTRRFASGTALDGLELSVPRGQVLALLGPNGAGKTTTVRLFNGLLTPDSGECRVLGIDPARHGTEVRRRTGVLTENAGLDDRLTALENVVFVARMHGLSNQAAHRNAMVLLEQFGMAERANQTVQGMSTGQRKRVALARSIIHDPEVLFLDEPTSGLDPAATRAVLDLVRELARERDRTVVLCTHFLGEADHLASHIAVLHRGQLRAAGRPAELAEQLFPGLVVEIDLSRAATAAELGVLSGLRNVHHAKSSEKGALLRVDHREDVPGLVRYLVEAGWDIYGATPKPMTVEDVYFAVQAEVEAEQADGRQIVATSSSLAALERSAK